MVARMFFLNRYFVSGILCTLKPKNLKKTLKTKINNIKASKPKSWQNMSIKIVRRIANKSVTSSQQVCCVVAMEFEKRRDTTDFCLRQLVTDLLRICCGETTGKLV